MVDNAVLHYFPESPWIVKCAVNVRRGKKIVFRVVLRDVSVGEKWLARVYPGIPSRVIVHK